MNVKLSLFGVLLCILALPLGAIAADLDFNIAISGSEISLVKGHTDYQSAENASISKYERCIHSVDTATFNLESTGFIGDNHDISIETNVSATKSAKSGISGTDYIENVGFGDNKSCCVFGIRGSGHDLTLASIVAVQPTTLDYAYVIEAAHGEAGAGYAKQTKNVTTTSQYEIRGANVIVAGQQTCTRYPAAPADEESLKKRICPWGGDGEGLPIFGNMQHNRTSLYEDAFVNYTISNNMRHYVITR